MAEHSLSAANSRKSRSFRVRTLAGLQTLMLLVIIGCHAGPEQEEKGSREISSGDPSQSEAAGTGEITPWWLEVAPGSEPEPLFPQLRQPGQMEHSGVFSPDFQSFYWTVSDPGYQNFTVWVMDRSVDGWSPPRVAGFSGNESDHGTSFSAEGSQVFFASLRSAEEETSSDQWRLWTAQRGVHGWEEATLVDVPGSGEFWQSHPIRARGGALYFHRFSGRSDTDFDLFEARWQDGNFQAAEKLGSAINRSDTVEISPYLSPDQKSLVFASYDRPDGLGSGDLYVAHRHGDGHWLPARNLGAKVNSSFEESNPTITPDGKYLVYSSSRPSDQGETGDGARLLHLYWVSLEVSLEGS